MLCFDGKAFFYVGDNVVSSLHLDVEDPGLSSGPDQLHDLAMGLQCHQLAVHRDKDVADFETSVAGGTTQTMNLNTKYFLSKCVSEQQRN